MVAYCSKGNPDIVPGPMMSYLLYIILILRVHIWSFYYSAWTFPRHLSELVVVVVVVVDDVSFLLTLFGKTGPEKRWVVNQLFKRRRSMT